MNEPSAERPIGKNAKWLGTCMVIAVGCIAITLLLALHSGLYCLGMVGLLAGGMFFLLGYRGWNDSGVETPEQCLKDFCNSIRRGDTRRAWSLVALVDKDGYRRSPITTTEEEAHDLESFSFADHAEFHAYWTKVRAMESTSRLAVQPGAGVVQLTKDIAIVDMKLTLHRSLRPDGGEQHVRRILLRYGSEWRLFNGDALPPDELDKKWLDQYIAQLNLPTGANVDAG